MTNTIKTRDVYVVDVSSRVIEDFFKSHDIPACRIKSNIPDDAVFVGIDGPDLYKGTYRFVFRGKDYLLTEQHVQADITVETL